MPHEQEKLSVSLGAKVSDGSFGSRDFHYSYSTIVLAGETIDGAKTRAEAIVAKWVNEKVKRFTKKQNIK